MPARKAETFTLGAVDSRSNPANFPPDRAIRCLNWAPQANGALRLRAGYTVPMAATNDTSGGTTIHSLIYYEQFSAAAIGPQYALYGKGSQIWQFNLTTKTSTLVGTMPSGNPWGHFRAGNRLFIATGDAIPGGFQSWDGTTLRPVGIGTVSTPGTASVTSSTLGSIAPTSLSGYQLYAAWYNPVTQHAGNRTTVGTRLIVSATASAFVLTGFGQPPNAEWVTIFGRTNDGGQVPYWFVDSNGTNIVVGNTATMATIYLDSVNYLEELPFRNVVPGPFDKFARVGTRVFAHLSGSPFIYYFNDIADVQNANYIGRPEESSPLDQAESFPTGELPTAIHAYRFEGWFFSRNYLAIWSSLLQQQGQNPWRGPWPGGCVGQRAFVETPYGPFWVTAAKELATFIEDGVISVSDEYEASLLGMIADQYLAQTEIAYEVDQPSLVDQIVIRGLDVNGNPVIVVHDFKLKDARSPFGQGYNYQYTGLTVRTFAGAGFTPRQNVFDVNGKMRLWAGAKEGFLAQLEDGNSDNGAIYSADHITILNLGPNRPGLAEVEYQGDANVAFSYLADYSQALSAFVPVTQDLIPGETSRYGMKLTGEARWVYMRFQLTAHPADGNFTMTDPPFLPLPTYGIIGEVTLKLGRERPEGR